MRAIIIKYGELWLKSDPVMKDFAKALRDSIKKQFKEAGVDCEFQIARDMLLLKTSNIKKALEILSRVFGISVFAEAEEVRSDMDSLKKAVLEAAKTIGKDQTFAIRASRNDKSFPFSSILIEDALGKIVKRKVNLSSPDVTIRLEVRKEKSYVFTERIKGLGGLPYGVSGKVLSLMSGQFDSPVASWLMMKRGCQPEFVYFSSYPLVPKKDRENVIRVLRQLKGYSPEKFVLHVVPFAKINEYVMDGVSPKYSCVIGKRIMLKISESLAKVAKCHALVTGDNIGQVASQTLSNISTEDRGLKIPVLRPVIGLHKNEILKIAREIGTYEISEKIKTSCPLTSRRPATRTSYEDIAGMEKDLKKLNGLMKKALKEREIIYI